MSMPMVTIQNTDEIMNYLEDLSIDIPCFRRPEKLRLTMSVVGQEAKVTVNVFDDKSGLAWAIDLHNRTYSRCKEGKWSKQMSVDGFGFDELNLDIWGEEENDVSEEGWE